MKTSLILGGARSGKSRLAQQLAQQNSSCPVYLATSRMWDDDHRARIERHKRDRGPEWTSLEEEKHISRLNLRDRVIVIDCMTLFLTNFFVDTGFDEELSLSLAKQELEGFLALGNHCYFVSNELGQGVHASTEAGRKFIDLQGRFNQHLASCVDTVALMVAGIPLTVKGVLT